MRSLKMDELNCNFYCYIKTRSKINVTAKKIDRLKLVIFDMDGVLTDIQSSWKYIHDFFNTSNEESVDLYVRGKISDEEFIRRDVALWNIYSKPLSKEKIEEILSNVPIMRGADRLIDFLKKHNIKTGIVSAGLDLLANKVARDLGIDFFYANGIKTDKNGFLTGEGIVNVKLMYKDETIKKISKEKGFALSNICVIGNSCFDIPMFYIVGLGIAFNPSDDCVQRAADHVIIGNNLEDVIFILERYL